VGCRRTRVLVQAYCRCNGGDYFVGGVCPVDGWSSPASEELTRLVQRLRADDRPLSLEALKAASASEATLKRTIVVQFGSEEAAFEAITPRAYVVGGKVHRPNELRPGYI
jgi:hypothetical protein